MRIFGRPSLHPRRRSRPLWPLIGLLLALAGPAWAPQEAAARKARAAKADKGKKDKPLKGKRAATYNKHMAKAMAFDEAGRFEDSLKELQAAYELQQMPKLLLNIAQAHQKLGRAKEAVEFYELYLKTETDLTPERKAEVEAAMQKSKDLLATADALKKREPGGAEADKAKAEADKEKEAQDLQAQAAAEAKAAAEKEAEAQAAAEAQAQAEKPPLPPGALPSADREVPVLAARKAPPPPTPLYKKWWLWTGIGVVVAGAAVGTALGLTLRSSSSPPDPMLPLGLDVRKQRF